MGNEASLEGGEGGLSGLPEGIVSDGKGGFIQIPAGTEADLSKLSEEERKQIAAVMSRAQAKPPGNAKDTPTQRTSEVDANHQPRQPGKPPTQGPSGLSKSRTVDAFRTGPPSRQAQPGRSPSSLSLLDSFSRQEAKEETRSSMFSSNFLSGANPLSAVSSAVNKFSLFGDEEPEEEKKQKAAPAQQAGKPSGQQAGATKAPHSSSRDPKNRAKGPLHKALASLVPHRNQGRNSRQLLKQGPPGAGAQTAGPAKAGAPPEGPGKAGPKPSQGPGPGPAGQKSPCPLCKTTELNLHTKDQPNYNTCTQCKTIVCSLCGFSPPDSAGKEWLCLNCQMQRALGGMDDPAPPMMKPQPQSAKPPSAPSSPLKKQAPPETQPAKSETVKPSETKKPSPLKKQPTLSDTGKPGTPPSTPPAARKGPGQATQKSGGPQDTQKQSGTQKPVDQAGAKTAPTAQQKAVVQDQAKQTQQPPQQKPPQQQTPVKPTQQPPSDQKPSGAPKTDTKTGHSTQEQGKPQQQMPKGGPGPSPAKSAPQPQAQPPAQPPKQESGFFGLSFGGFSEPPKSQPTTPQPTESVSGKLFGFGGFSDTAKQPAPKQPAAAPPAESVSGKMFGFGSSIFSSASNLITSTVQDEPPAQPPAAPKEPAPAQPSPKKPPVTETKPPVEQKAEKPQQAKASPPTQEKKTAPTKAEQPPHKAVEPSPPPPEAAKSNCPLCKVELNVGSKDPPNYNTCTECKKTVCNLCGFNPMPHLNEKEWLCLNCQTQRALAGQLGDLPPPMPAPTKPENQKPTAPKAQPSPRSSQRHKQ
ncbi:hypothetical protein AGOR_G00182170 [Albula goreensis]|uniref:Zinc finger piccolo-type domain-containing protein n=1 Tax=Albula goreensis TaxID=1534307 RepID=A0A8T3CWP5_9TELE|nr:hypothetical protein AGOR_G00182170 [Albula goreensis]